MDSFPPDPQQLPLRAPWRAPQRPPEWMADAPPLLASGWRRPSTARWPNGYFAPSHPTRAGLGLLELDAEGLGCCRPTGYPATRRPAVIARRSAPQRRPPPPAGHANESEQAPRDALLLQDYVPTVFDNFSANVVVDSSTMNFSLWDIQQALDKIRFESLIDKSKLDAQPELFIHIIPDKATNTVTLIDSGISMTKSDLGNNLGTILMSGMKEFMEALAAGADVSIIGRLVSASTPLTLLLRVLVTTKHNDAVRVAVSGWWVLQHFT